MQNDRKVYGISKKIMIKDNIQELREHLNSIIVLRNIDYEEVLKVSRELDELILRYYQTSPLE